MGTRDVFISENIRRCGQCQWFKLNPDASSASRFGICSCTMPKAARRYGQLIPRCLSAAHGCEQFILSDTPLFVPASLKQQEFDFDSDTE